MKPNLKKEEWNVAMDLKNDEDLIIIKSDKGSACVIMDIEYYKNKIELMLHDESTYKEINNPNKNKRTLNNI